MKRHDIPANPTYRQQYTCCGKCPRQPCQHGPYWYAEWRNDKGQVQTAYIGKHLPLDLTPPPAAPPAPQPSPPMTKRQALAILGIGFDWSYLKGQKRWQFLQKVYGNEGDKGRSALVEVNEAWALICDDLV